MGKEDWECNERFQAQHFRAECLRLALDTFRPPATPDGYEVLATAQRYVEWVLGE